MKKLLITLFSTFDFNLLYLSKEIIKIMSQIQTTRLIKDHFKSRFVWRINNYKELAQEGFLDTGRGMRSGEIAFSGIPFKW